MANVTTRSGSTAPAAPEAHIRPRRQEASGPGRPLVPQGSLEARSVQEGIAEVGGEEVGAVEPGVGEVGVVESRSRELGAVEVGPAESRLRQVTLRQVGPLKVGVAEVLPPQVHGDKARPAQVLTAVILCGRDHAALDPLATAPDDHHVTIMAEAVQCCPQA
jgi:hypothetical protein